MDIRAVRLLTCCSAFKYRALFLAVSFLFSLSCYAVQEVQITVFRHYESGRILWGGDGASAFSVLQLERRGIWLYSYVLEVSGYLSGYDIAIADDDSLQSVYDRLGTNPPEDMKYVDWEGDWTRHITPYYPSGTVVYDSEGNPSGVVMNMGGELSTVPLIEHSEYGWRSAETVYQGVTGSWTVTSSPDTGGWMTTFIPSWGGGISDTSSPTTSIDPFFPQIYVSGGGGSGGDSGDTFIFPQVTTITDSEGAEVITVPRHDITIGGAGGSSSTTIPVYDYTGILSAIGGILESFAFNNNQALTTINENQQKYFEITDNDDLGVAPTDDTDYEIDYAEGSDIITTVSGWGFDFGMGSNPLGNFFTTLLGNPPTSFGSVDRVWSIDFPIFGNIKVTSSFNLSDWFPRAFRSCVLMILSIVFAIACAKAISGAFS